MSRKMNSQPAPAPVAGSYEGLHQANTLLHGRWLVSAWIAWLALVIPPMVVFLAGLPGYRENEYQSNLIYAASFHQIGITVDFYASYYLEVVIGDAVICWSVAALVLWRKSNDWMGLLTALMLILLGMQYIPLGPVLGPLKGYLSNICVFLFFCLFPNGRFVPRWLRWALLLSLVCGALLNFTPFNRMFLLVGIGLVFVGMAAQIYRYSVSHHHWNASRPGGLSLAFRLDYCSSMVSTCLGYSSLRLGRLCYSNG